MVCRCLNKKINAWIDFNKTPILLRKILAEFVDGQNS